MTPPRVTNAVTRTILLVSLTAITSVSAFGQSESSTPAFEVASVKPTVPSLPGGGILINMTGGPGTADPGRFNYMGLPLKRLLIRAYGVKNSEISGPDWLDTERYDIVAKLPPASSIEQFQLMLQNLLAERFQMKVHREKKEVPVYALVIAKGEPKLKDASPGPRSRAGKSVVDGLFRVVGTNEPMPRFAEYLAGELGRPVIDMTALQGSYDFVVDWPQDDHGATLPAALQAQIGLKLESRKSPMELLIVDHAEKIPTGN